MNEVFIEHAINELKRTGLLVNMVRGYRIAKVGLNEFVIAPLTNGDFLTDQTDEAGVRSFLQNISRL